MSFTWREGARQTEIPLGEPTFQVFLENALKSLKLGRVARLLLANGTLLGELAFWTVLQLAEARRPWKERFILGQLLTLVCLWWLSSLSRVQNNNPSLHAEKRLLVERAIKKLNLLSKSFFCPRSCLLCLAGKYKTWTPGPWNPSVDQAHGLGPSKCTPGPHTPFHGPRPWAPHFYYF